jgi:hypothetical protein
MNSNKKKNQANAPRKGRQRNLNSDVINKLTNRVVFGRLTGTPAVFPRSVVVCYTMAMSGFIAAGGARQNYLITVPGNGLYEPGAGNTNAANASVSANVTAMTGSVGFSTATPPGYTIWAAMYKQYTVRKSQIRVTVTPVNVGDLPLLSVFPFMEITGVGSGYSGTSGSVVPAGDEAAQMPFGDSIECQAYTPVNGRDGNTITLEMTTAKVNGITEAQYANDVVNGTLIGSNPNISAGNQDLELPWSWAIAIGNMTNANFSGNLCVKIEICWEARMFDPISPLA